MKIKNFSNIIDNFQNYSSLVDFDNFFDIYFNNKNQKYNFNLNSTIYFDISDNECQYFIVNMDLHWPIISYNIYGTPKLSWLLIKLNNVKPENIFNKVLAGTKIKCLPYETVQTIIESFLNI